MIVAMRAFHTWRRKTLSMLELLRRLSYASYSSL